MSKILLMQMIVIFTVFIGSTLMPSVLSRDLPKENGGLTGSIVIENQPYTAPSSSSQYYAVIVACSHYKNPKYNLPRKPFPPFSDSKLTVFYNALVQSKNWNESHIILLLNDHATKQNITAALVQMAEIVGSNDFFLFSWSGHGTEVPDKDGDESSRDPTDTFDEAICPYDIYTDENLSKQNVIADDELGNYFSNITCKGMCLIFDCCLSGGMVDRNTTNRTMGTQLDLSKIASFTSDFSEEIKTPRSTDVNGNNRVVLVSTEPDLLERANYLTGFPLVAGIAFACTHGSITDRNRDGVISAEEAFNVARTLVYVQSSFLWIGSWMYSYFAFVIKYDVRSFFLASLVVIDMYLTIQMVLKLFTNHPMGNFPIMQDDYNGELPLIEL